MIPFSLNLPVVIASIAVVSYGVGEIRGRHIGSVNERTKQLEREREMLREYDRQVSALEKELRSLESSVLNRQNQTQKVIERVKEIPIEVAGDCRIPFGAVSVLQNTSNIQAVSEAQRNINAEVSR